MNALESEYSFLAPTWKLPTVATPSMYSYKYGTPLLSREPELGLDWILWKNTLQNSRYVPSYTPPMTSRRDYSVPATQQRIPPLVLPYQSPNHQTASERPQVTRSFQHPPPNNSFSNDTHPPNHAPVTPGRHPNVNQYEPQAPTSHQHTNQQATYRSAGPSTASRALPPKRRVQIIDPNRQTPSTAINEPTSGRNSYNSNQIPSDFSHHRTPEMNKSQARSKPSAAHQHRDHAEENRFGYTENRFNLHEYLYGLAAPDPGSYVDAFRQHQRRLQDEKITRRYVLNDYRNFAQNGGFGPTFGSIDHRLQRDKINNHTRRKSYSKAVQVANQFKSDEQKRLHTGYAQQRNSSVAISKHQRHDATKSHFSSAQEAREYADKIGKPQHTKALASTNPLAEPPVFLPLIITPVPNLERRSSAGALPLTEFNINQSRFSSSSYTLPTQPHRVRFHAHNDVRRRSSTFTASPSYSSKTYRLVTCKDCHKPIPIDSDGNDYRRTKNSGAVQRTSRQKDRPAKKSRQTQTAIGSDFTHMAQVSIPSSMRQSSTKFRLEDFDVRQKTIRPRVENDSSHQ